MKNIPPPAYQKLVEKKLQKKIDITICNGIIDYTFNLKVSNRKIYKFFEIHKTHSKISAI